MLLPSLNKTVIQMTKQETHETILIFAAAVLSIFQATANAQNKRFPVAYSAMAYSEGVERLFRDKELAMKVIGKYTKTTDRDAQDAAYGFATTFVERPPRLPYKAVETILAQIAEKDPRAKAHKPDDFIDPTFYNELVKSGFFKNASR